MNWKRITLVLLIVGLISGGYYWWRNSSPYDYVARRDVALEVFGSQPEFDAFLSATDVTVQRVHYRGEHKGNSGVLSEFGFESAMGYEHETSIPIAPASYEEIKRLLKVSSSYVWDGVKGCGPPRFGMLMHFHSTNITISVAICFHCKQLGVFNSTASPIKMLNIENDFDPINERLVALAKSIFPSDREIQQLK